MSRILILYYSGVGNTKRVSEIISNNISPEDCVTTHSIEKLPVGFSINQYDAIIIGFPTIHASPAEPILAFLENIPELEKAVPTYVFTTCGLYSANSLRIFGKNCIRKNMIPVLNRSYRCAATDGILLAPYMKCWFTDEKNLGEKLQKDTSQFLKILKEPLKAHIPRIKVYSILNYPNKRIGQMFPFKITLHKEKCIRCKKCISNCPVQAYIMDENNFPSVNKSKCISCYRCIHHCSQRALSLYKKNTPEKTLFIQ